MGPLAALMLVLAQPGAPDTRCATGLTPTTYLEAVDAYRDGRLVEAIRLFTAIAPDELPRYVEALASTRDEDVRRSDDCIVAASLLHFEAAVVAAHELDWLAMDPHLESGWHLTGSIRSRARRRRFRRDWLLVTGLLHQSLIFDGGSRASFVRAKESLDEAAERNPEDAEVLVAAGALYEWSGSLRLGKRRHLADAERLYEHALRADPAGPEAPVALVRLGSVLEKRGASERAEAALVEAIERADEPHLIYRARMIQGRLAELGGSPGAAADRYRQAVLTLPGWQVGYLALSHALRVGGDPVEARRRLRQGLEVAGTDESFFGWWSYELGLSPRMEPLFLSMRREVVR